ncbi:hypothetical protein [Methanogenium cariaci]|nr:hypothetical protein [Methanogenium cariaci]
MQLTNTNAASKTYVVAVKKAQITKGWSRHSEQTENSRPLQCRLRSPER